MNTRQRRNLCPVRRAGEIARSSSAPEKAARGPIWRWVAFGVAGQGQKALWRAPYEASAMWRGQQAGAAPHFQEGLRPGRAAAPLTAI